MRRLDNASEINSQLVNGQRLKEHGSFFGQGLAQRLQNMGVRQTPFGDHPDEQRSSTSLGSSGRHS